MTEMVYEECADNEEVHAQAQPTVSEQPKKTPSLPKAATKSKEPTKGQKSMTSFFGGKK